MADVLFVNAPVEQDERSNHASLNPPLGLGYIASTVRAEGYEVAAVDFNISGMSERRFRATLSRVSPSVVGISAHTETYPNALKLASIASRHESNPIVVLGGPHPTVEYETAVMEQAVDFVVLGEGERTFVDLLDAIRGGKSPREVQGIATERGGEVHHTGRRPFIEDPDSLPYPARDLFPLHLYQSPGNLLFSRGGCPFNCHFCAVNSIWNDKSRRFREPEAVVDEIRELVEGYGIDHINFADDVFTLHRAKTEELLDHIESLSLNRPWSWTCATRVDLVDADLLNRLSEAGCTGIQFGVEAGSQEILDRIGKKLDTTEIEQSVRDAAEAELDVLASFMFPHPDDTEATIRSQIEFMQHLSSLGADLSLAYTTPYPGTEYESYVADGEIEVRAESWSEYDAKHLMISTRHLSFDELEVLRDELLRETGLKRETTTPEPLAH